MQDMMLLARRCETCSGLHMPNYDDILDLLIRLRRDAGDSQEAIAERLGVHQVTVSGWERKRTKIPIDAACEWAEAYGHRLDVFPEAGARGEAVHSLVVAGTSLDDEQLAALQAIAKGLPNVSKVTMLTLVALVESLEAKAVSKRA